jgi:hypothetical protein
VSRLSQLLLLLLWLLLLAHRFWLAAAAPIADVW